MGVTVGDDTIYLLLFADDQLLMTEDYEDLQYMARKLKEEYEKWGLKINMEKTKHMAIGDKSKDLVLEDGQGTIKVCNDYIYFGTKITADGGHGVEINERINKGRSAISKLNGVLWDENISSKTKTTIFNTIIRSTMTYGAETWELKS